ncbi:phage tail protein [Basfia succiniciproducens]|uniref:phage tail protein n=1 Tax=Basfia succiniciproducens TaxID=653940 RepID=UPI003FCCB99E
MASLILTPEWAEEIYQLETSDPVMGGPDGIDNRQAIQLGKRTEYLKQDVEKRAPIASPTFTGTPKAPTAKTGTATEQLATTQFVSNAISALVGSAPETLDTLAEIAQAMGEDESLKETLLTEIGKKATNEAFSTLKNLLIGIPFPYPLSAVPDGCLAFNGQTFSTTTYPELAKKYPSGRLPDLRGEFIRGWDNGRGVDSSRELLRSQGAELSAHTHYVTVTRYANSSGEFGAKISTFSAINNSGWSLSGADGLLLAANKSGEIVSEKNSVANLISNTGGNETRPRNVAFQYICLAK